MTQQEAIVYLDKIAADANMLARLYEDMADSFAGFDSAEDYEREAAEAFESAQASIDAWERMP